MKGNRCCFQTLSENNFAFMKLLKNWAYLVNFVTFFWKYCNQMLVKWFVSKIPKWKGLKRSKRNKSEKQKKSRNERAGEKSQAENWWCNCWLLGGSYLGFSVVVRVSRASLFAFQSQSVSRSGTNLATCENFSIFWRPFFPLSLCSRLSLTFISPSVILL